MAQTPPNTPLDYAPIASVPSGSQRVAAASVWLGLAGIVWGFIGEFMAAFVRMGKTKSIQIDGLIDLTCVAPSILAVVFGLKAIFDWRRSGIVAGAGWIIYVATFFVKEVLLSPQPYWDSI